MTVVENCLLNKEMNGKLKNIEWAVVVYNNY
jgi:hypothetical protein